MKIHSIIRLFKHFWTYKTIGFLFIFLSLCLCSCKDETECKIYTFIGDSIIEGWPIDETLPSRLVYNYGKSGAGISYLKGYQHSFSRQEVVVMIGTNDNYIFYSEDLDSYVSNYLITISGLTDQNIYLFSVLPREHRNDPIDINDKIKLFNNKVKTIIDNYPNIIYVDVFDDFIYNNHINYQYFYDGLHLTIYGYEILTSKLLHLID